MHRKRLMALLTVVLMVFNMMPTTVMSAGFDTDNSPVGFLPEDMDVNELVEKAGEEVQQIKLENTANISPEMEAIQGILDVISKEGYVYFSCENGVTIYPTTEITEETEPTIITDSLVVLYADGISDGMLHVLLADSEGNLIEGYAKVSASSEPLTTEFVEKTFQSVKITRNEKEIVLFKVSAATSSDDSSSVENNTETVDIAPILDDEDVISDSPDEEVTDNNNPEENVNDTKDSIQGDEGNEIANEASENTDQILDNNENILPESDVLENVDKDIVDETILPPVSDNANEIDNEAEQAKADVVPEEDLPDDNENITPDENKEEPKDNQVIEPVEEVSKNDPVIEPVEENNDPTDSTDLNEIEPETEVNDEEPKDVPVTEPEDVPEQSNNVSDDSNGTEVPVQDASLEEKHDNEVKEPITEEQQEPKQEPVEEKSPEENSENTADEAESVTGFAAINESEEIIPEDIQNQEVVPVEEAMTKEIKSNDHVQIIISDGEVPAGAEAYINQYNAAESKRLVDKWIYGIEDTPIKLKSVRKTQSTAPVDIKPEGTEISDGSEGYVEGLRVEKLPGKPKTGSYTGYAAFAVGITVDDAEYNGNGAFDVTINPETAINITDGIRKDAVVTNTSFKIYHIHNDAMEEIPLPSENVTIEGNAITAVSFPVENFSDFILSYTVDFTYTDPISKITLPTISILNGTEILLSELLSQFGIYDDVTNSTLSYTDESQLQFTPYRDEFDNVYDWGIAALKPFKTNEKLTVYLANDNIVEIDVTDNDYEFDISQLVDQGFDEGEIEYSQTGTDYNVRNAHFVSTAGGASGVWKTDGEQTYIPGHMVRKNGVLSYEYIYCVQPKKDQPTSSSGGVQVYNKTSEYGNVAVKFVVRNGYPFYIYQGDRFSTRQMTSAAIRQVLVFQGSSYVENKHKIIGVTLTTGSHGNTLSNPNSSTASAFLNYARWLASEAIEEESRLASSNGAITISNKDGLNGTGPYTGSFVVNTGCDTFIIPTSSNYTLTGAYKNDGSYYYFRTGATVGVSTSQDSFSATIQSYSSTSEVGLAQYRCENSDYQNLIVPYKKDREILQSQVVSLEAPNGFLKITKVDKDLNKNVGGVSFLITGPNNYRNTVTTGADGTVTVTLPQGTYTVHENVPARFISPVADQQATITPSQTTSKTFENRNKLGNVTVYKYRAQLYTGQTAVPLSGAVVRLCAQGTTTAAKDLYGNVFPDHTTNDSGNAGKWIDIPYGTYDIREITAPTGYQNAGVLMTFTMNENGQHIELRKDTTNMPIFGSIGVKKVRAGRTSEPVPGAKFELLEYNNGDKKTAQKAKNIHNNVTPELTTDANGNATWADIEYGKYWVHEIAAANGYYLDPTADDAYQEVTISTQNESPIKAFATPNIVQTWTINVDHKWDAQTKEPLAGIKFKVTRISGLDYGKSDLPQTFEMTTDASGKASLSGLTTGVYEVEELVPTGDKAKYNRSVVYTDGIVTGTTPFYKTRLDLSTTDRTVKTLTYPTPMNVSNQPNPGRVRLIKTDSLNKNPIPGIQFEVYKYYAQNGDTVFEKTDYPKYICTITTDANGIALSPEVEPGCYYIIEKQPTPGYLFEKVEFDNVIVNSDEVTPLTAVNKPVQVSITFYKRDAEKYTGEMPAVASKTVGDTYEWIVGPDRDYTQTVSLPVTKTIQAPITRGDALLTDAEYKILADEPIKDRQGNVIFAKDAVVIASIKTAGDDASFKTTYLWPGKYRIEEVTAPDGYRMNTAPIIVDTTPAAKQSFEEKVNYQALQKEEVKRSKLSLVKFLGDNQTAAAGDATVEVPEEGAEFEVFLSAAGSYADAKEDEREIIVTDADGLAKTGDLPWGVYTVKQTKGKYTYQIKVPFKETMHDDLRTYSEIINNFELRVYLRLIKIDEETGKTITMSGVTFKLKDIEGNTVKIMNRQLPTPALQEEFTTDKTGMVMLPDTVTCGTYYITEITSPEGYLIREGDYEVNLTPSKIAEDAKVNPDDATMSILDVEIEDKPVKGKIYLDKYGKQLIGFQTLKESGYEYHQPVFEEKFLAGCEFEIHAAEDIVGKDGTLWFSKDELVDTITTTANGNDTHTSKPELPLGKYYLMETKAPVGYVYDAVKYPVELTFKDNVTRLVTTSLEANNRYLPIEANAIKLQTEFVPEETEDGMVHLIEREFPGNGFIFGLYNKEALVCDEETLPANSCVSVAVSDANGNVQFTGYVPHGEYYIQELEAPKGWEMNTDKFDVSLTADNKADNREVIVDTLPEEIVNHIIHKDVTITKSDLTESETVPGALIEVYDEEGNIIYREYTDENGVIPDIPLVPGKYTFREILAPEGYELNEAILNFEVTEDYEVIGDTIIHDDYTRVQFTKVDSLDGTPIHGAEFALIREPAEEGGERETVLTATSDEHGLVTFEKIPWGTFTIEETKPTDGYDLRKGPLTAAFVVDGKFVNSKETPPEVINEPNTFFGIKVDQDEKPLSNAKIGLYDKETEELLQTAISNNEGRFEFRRIKKGSYIIKEIEPPTDKVDENGKQLYYLPSRVEIPLEVEEFTQSPEESQGTIVNKEKHVKYIKVETSGKYLEGVEFSLINKETEEVVEVVTSDENGVFEFTQFDYGDWIVRETKAPEGYNILDDMEFHVDDDWVEPEPFTCINIPNHYEFVKTDNEGNPIPGARFVLETKDGKAVGEFVSGEDGIIHVTDMKPGTYVIREIETPEGFLRTDETIEVVVDEHYVVPEEMYHLCNTPNHYEFVKTDTTGKPLAGAIFALEDLNGNKVGEFKSGEDGIVHVKFLEKGTYVIKEITTPEGFMRTDENIKVVVDEHYVVPKEMYTLCNIPNHYEFVKTDNNGKPLAGVKFTLEDLKGNSVGTFVSGDDGIVHVTFDKPGTYIIREIETLEGFTRTDETIKVEVNEKYVVPKVMYKLVNYPKIQTGVEISNPFLWIGIGALVFALVCGGFMIFKKKKVSK